MRPTPTDQTLHMHCGVFQHLARTIEYDHPEMKLDAVQTRVGWRRCEDGKIELVVQFCVTGLKIGEEWIAPDFKDAEHKEVLSALDVSPWLRRLDSDTRAWIKRAAVRRMLKVPTGEFCTYTFCVPVAGNVLSDAVCDYMCAMLQRFALDQPPMCATARFDPPATKITWERAEHSDIVFKVRVKILRFFVAEEWTEADYTKPQHRDLASAVDLTGWFGAQTKRARELVRKLSLF